MILKKPYAFLIKYFKLINFIISILMGYIAYKSYNIVTFFNEYIGNNYTGNYYPGFSNNYISPFIYLILIILLLLIAGIYLLLLYKKKPAKIYIFSLVYYAIFIIYLVIVKNTMIALETSVTTAEIARVYRDVSIIAFIPQTFLIIMYIFRGLGFNIHKFNFDKDIKELEIEEQDNEEVEITFKKDGVKLKRNIKRFIREFKYYIKENKFMFTIICIILLILIAFLIYHTLPTIVDSDYNQGETFKVGNLIYKVEDSIITNLNYKGEYISKSNYYLVVKINIENTTNNKVQIDYNNFRLVLNDSYVYPSIDKGKNFIDYAKDYYSKEIKANSNGTYSLVYEIKEKDLKKNYEIKISNGSTTKDNLVVGKHNYITISPIIIDKVNVQKKVNAGEEINFSNSNLGNSKLTLSNPIITNKYIYNYEYCVKEKCETYKDIINVDYLTNNSILIVMDYNYEIDNTIPFYDTSSNINTFIKTFMKVKYTNENNESNYLSIKNVTPSKLEDKIVIETSNVVEGSNNVELSITIRNKEYLVKIK